MGKLLLDFGLRSMDCGSPSLFFACNHDREKQVCRFSELLC